MVKFSPKTRKASFQVNMPEAEIVAVVGEFNGWNSDATPMKKNKTGVWRTDVKLDDGDYQFRYLVNNNEWHNDDKTPAVPNDFGTENSLLHIEHVAVKKPAAKKATARKSNSSSKA